MLYPEPTQGVNFETSTSTSIVELTGSYNGHSASFVSGSTISIPDVEVACSCIPEKKTISWPRRLPNRRGGFNQRLKMSDGMKLYLRTGEYSDGTLGEIFVDTQKEGTFARAMLNCFAVAVSTGLQHGVPLQVFIDQFKNVMFEPKGMVEGSDYFESATSIIDAIFKELEVSYPEGKNPKVVPVRASISKS